MGVVGKATGSAPAMLLIEQAQPDVVLLDLDLGKENGLDAIPELLKKSAAKILVLTGVRDTSAHEAAIRAGALGVVGKEVAPAELLQAIARVHRGELSVDRQTTERLARARHGAGRRLPTQRFDGLTMSAILKIGRNMQITTKVPE